MIHPTGHYNTGSRAGVGAAILTVFYVLLIAFLTSYLRLWQTVNFDTGYLPRGAQWTLSQGGAGKLGRRHSHRRHHRRKGSGSASGSRGTEKIHRTEADLESGLDDNASAKAFPLGTAGLESFYTKDAFVCQDDGRPAYCSTCCGFKMDRAHHCREVNRCIRKMDHFCPW